MTYFDKFIEQTKEHSIQQIDKLTIDDVAKRISKYDGNMSEADAKLILSLEIGGLADCFIGMLDVGNFFGAFRDDSGANDE